MDLQTLKYYAANANELAGKYDNFCGGISDYFQQSFEKNGKILDIGCGSGRDLKILHEMGYAADGVDPCDEFVECCNRHKTGYGSIVIKDSLPELKEIPDKSYDGVLCSAVLMHLPKEQLFDASFAIRRILKDNGKLLISVPLPDETIDGCSKRDPSGRLFNGITPENFQLIFERIGFSLITRWENRDALGREHRKWAVMLFKLESDSGSRPIDTIESVLNKDRKVATYKLALFRALAELAMTNYNLAIWRRDGNVALPIENIAEKWIEYYWPIFESKKFIPQIQAESENGKPIAFRALLSSLIESSKLTGGLSGFASFAINSRNRELGNDVNIIYRRLLSRLKTTLVEGPIKHAGGVGDDSVFGYDKGHIVIPHGIWMELSLMGHWIQDATILRWGELTAKISKGCIKPSEVIDCLLTVPIPEREIYSAKSFYDGLKHKECVWSGKSISKEYEVDHAIPFSLWKNNDLWNLFPTSSTENRNKKDKLPENFVVKRSKGTIVEYWKLMRERYPVRFEYEAEKFSGISFKNNKTWENTLFANFAEAIEITAIQRGVERWQPANFAATGISDAYPQMKSDTGKVHEQETPYNAGGKSKIVKIVSGGQTGADRGGLDAAIALGIPHGGWCPKGRLAEDGVIPDKYNQTETSSKNYAKRTEKNVVASSATSIFTNGSPTGGSKKTAEFAEKHGKPYICIDTGKPDLETTERLIDWTRHLRNSQIVLNVAGSRESKAPGIQKQVAKIVGNLITEVNEIGKAEMEETPAKIAVMFFPDLRIACGAFKSDSSRTDYDAETIEVENPHGNLDPKKHFVVRASGNSMDGGITPIRDGDMLLLEKNEGGTVSNQIFAVEFQDEFGGTAYALKRIEKDNPDRYRLVSANKDYDDIQVATGNMFPFARLKKNLGKI